MVHVAVNKYDFEKVNILEYAFGEGGGGHQKAYAVYAFINVDNCERPLRTHIMTVKSKGGQPNYSCRVLAYIQHNYFRTLNDVGLHVCYA